ncbi:TRAM domain-containing protein, partial [Gluconobacter oxydans]|uniref:TRAM domain-containing protein n=1 Tax=Gluconobacter oxydans TaxID=442 RepID=UPI0039ECBE65
MTGVAELRIEGLGAAGDGVAHLDGQTVFIPGTLPGEDIRVRLAPAHPELIDIVHASPDRVTPPCDLFGECGGCALQH